MGLRVGETTSITSTTEDGQKVKINNGLASTRLSSQATSMMKMVNAYWNSQKHITSLTTPTTSLMAPITTLTTSLITAPIMIQMMSLMLLTKNLTTLVTSLTKVPITVLTTTQMTSYITAPTKSLTTALTMALITTPTTSPIMALTTIPTTQMVTSMSCHHQRVALLTWLSRKRQELALLWSACSWTTSAIP